MMITANNQKVETSLINKAIARAKDSQEKIAIVYADFNGQQMHCLTTLAGYEVSENKDNMELVAVYDPNGNRVD